MMRCGIIFVASIISLLRWTFGITCNLCDEKSCKSQCTGDYCKIMKITTSDTRAEFSQGCYNGDLPPGNHQSVCSHVIGQAGNEIGVECYCYNEPTCNNDALIQNSTIVNRPPIDCELFGDEMESNHQCKGVFCEMSYAVDEDGSKSVNKGCAGSAFPAAIRLELTPESPPACISMTGTDPPNDGYVIRVECKCASNMCNNDAAWLAQLPSSNINGQVTCYQQQCTAPESCVDYGTCKGDYCYVGRLHNFINTLPIIKLLHRNEFPAINLSLFQQNKHACSIEAMRMEPSVLMVVVY